MELRNWYIYLDLAPQELKELVDMAIQAEDKLTSVESLTELGFFPPSAKVNELVSSIMGIIRQLHYLASSLTKSREEREKLDKSKREMEKLLEEKFSKIELALSLIHI